MFLKTEDLTKTYQTKGKEAIDALKNVSLSFPDKGLVFMLGESGSGKSTLLFSLGGLLKPTSGSIFYHSKPLSGFSQEDLEAYRFNDIGLVFQNNEFVEDLDVRGNIALALPKDKQADWEIVSNALRKVSLPGFEKRRISELSGGQKQRVAIARAVVKECPILLCDEPTAALDEESAETIYFLLQSLAKERLIICSTHDRDSAFRYADRIIELKNGCVLQDIEATQDGGEIIYSGNRVFIPRNHTITREENLNLNQRFKEEVITKVFSGPSARSFKKRDGQEEKKPDETSPKVFSGFSFPKWLGLRFFAKRKKRHILAVVLLGLTSGFFGTSLVANSFDSKTHTIETLAHASANYLALKKTVSVRSFSSDYQSPTKMFDEDIEEIYSRFGEKCLGVHEEELPFHSSMRNHADIHDKYTNSVASGIAVAEKSFFESHNYKFVTGTYPENDDQAVISTEMADGIRRHGYHNPTLDINDYCDDLPIGFDYENLLGKPIDFGKRTFFVSGVVKFDTDYARYDILKDDTEVSVKSFFGNYVSEYAECIKDDFAWNIYVKDLTQLGIDHYDKAVMSIPKEKAVISKIYEASKEDKDYFIYNAHIRNADFIANNMKLFAGIFSIFGAGNALLSIMLIIHLFSSLVVGEKRHLGLFKSMGATNGAIIRLYAVQSFVLSCAAALSGLIFLIAVPSIINAFLANELLFVSALLSLRFWHFVVIFLVPFAISMPILLLSLAPYLIKTPSDLLK